MRRQGTGGGEGPEGVEDDEVEDEEVEVEVDMVYDP